MACKIYEDSIFRPAAGYKTCPFGLINPGAKDYTYLHNIYPGLRERPLILASQRLRNA
jgi:hypothetical protein